MMLLSTHGMGRPSVAVEFAIVNHVPGLKCKLCTQFVPHPALSQGEREKRRHEACPGL